MRKLAIVTTHPIQYNAPLFALLGKRNRIHIKVFYTWGKSVLDSKFDPGFNKKIEWDIPLLEGYEYAFVNNVSTRPGSHHYSGIINPTLIDEIENWGADAVLVYGWSFKSHFNIIRFFYGKKKILFRGDSTFVAPSSILKSFFRKRFLRYVYAHTDTCLYVGTHNKTYYLRAGVPERKLMFAPHAVDNERFAFDEEKRSREATGWRKELGIPENAVCLLFAGKLVEDKNAQLLIETLKSVSNPFAYAVIIVGNGDFENNLKQMANGLSNVHFLPFQNQAFMPVVYRLADIFIMPTRTSETWGLVINEAMACGKPVLVSDSCGAAIDLVKSGVNGFIFEAGNQQEFENKLNLMGTDKRKLQQMGMASASIIQNWSLQKLAEAVENAVLNG